MIKSIRVNMLQLNFLLSRKKISAKNARLSQNCRVYRKKKFYQLWQW